MSRVVILGATGSLGRHVVQQAISDKHDVAVVVRTPSKLTAEVRDKVSVHQCDLSSVSIGDLTAVLRGHDAVINTAGLVRHSSTSLIGLSPAWRPYQLPIDPPAGSSQVRGCWISMLPVGEESTCLASARLTGPIA